MRYLSLRWDEESPVLWLDGVLPADQGAALETVLNARAERLPADPEAVDPGGARLADALTEATAGSDPQSTTVVIHADAEAVAGAEPDRGPWLAESECGTRLASEPVRRLACDGRIEWLVQSEGRPVGIGRRGRQVPEALGRLCGSAIGRADSPAVSTGDGCLLTTSSTGPEGATDLDNLVLLCGSHHRLLHEGGWRTSGQPGGHLRFQDPYGRTLSPFAGWTHRKEIASARVAQPLRR